MSTQDQLTEARAALHRLITGTSTVSIQRDGKRVEFAQTNRSDLERYIDQLEVQTGAGLGRRRGPAGVIA
jgi:predicted house-cleaning NTP pyrophosphatase (Maf/HAM1 superfamily)